MYNDDELRELLEEEIKGKIEDLSNLNSGSKEENSAVDNLATLYRLKIEEQKNEIEAVDRREKRLMEKEHLKREEEIKEKQNREQKFDRWIGYGVQIGLTLAGMFAYGHWFHKGLKFEETGTVGSPMTRNLMSKMLPKK